MKKRIIIPLVNFLLGLSTLGHAQEEVTNAFDDLNRTGIVNEEKSEMRVPASKQDIQKLIAQHSNAGFLCFAEDREHDIRSNSIVPERWFKRPFETWQQLNVNCAPGEFYTWQIGVFAPFKPINVLSVKLSDLKNEKGKSISASGFQCFNLSGTDTNGKTFQKDISIEKGKVQALWMGIPVPTTAQGNYTGQVTVKDNEGHSSTVTINLTVKGEAVSNQGDDEGWRKSRLRWLNSTIGNADEPTAPYIPVSLDKQTISWLGGNIELGKNGLPSLITTRYTTGNLLSDDCVNHILADKMHFVIETKQGEEILKGGNIQITSKKKTEICWTSHQQNNNFKVTCLGTFGFDGIGNIQIHVKSKKDIEVRDIRLEVPYTSYASQYMMGLGHKGGYLPSSPIKWKWDTSKHQDKIWMGAVNAGMNLRFKDEHFVRPLVNIYYALGKINLPTSWGNDNKGGINISQKAGKTLLTAYSGERNMKKGETLQYNFDMQVTPVKPLNLKSIATERYYHSNSDVSSSYIAEAKKNGANIINIHHKKDIYPFINYPYHDISSADLKQFIQKAHQEQLKVKTYYTTRELTVKIPEIWALRSLGSEVIHDGPGKDTRTLIHRKGPNEWLNKNLGDHFIPAWYNAFKEGKYAGDMDISIITTPDSRWNNYYLEGLHWMVNNIGLDGIYIDDSALDRKTLQRARRVLDADGQRRHIDIHSWNHMNRHAGFANSLHIYTELLPYVDRTWIGEGFWDSNSPDFWLVEMSGIPFGLLGESLQSQNRFRGMIFGMLPRLPWSGNPVHLWKLWDDFDMQHAEIHGFWDAKSPVKTNNRDLPVTVYTNGDKALVVIANWTDLPQKGKISIDEKLLGFKPSKFSLPEIRDLQWGKTIGGLNQCEIMGRGGMIVLLEK